MNHYVYYIGIGLVAIALTACNQSPDSTESNGRIISTHPNSSQSVSSTNPLNKDTNVTVSPVNTDSATASKNLQTLGKQTVRIFYENCVLTGANSQKIAEQSKKINYLSYPTSKNKPLTFQQSMFGVLIQSKGGNILLKLIKTDVQ